MSLFRRRFGHKPDYTLMGLYFSVLVFGIIMLSSVSNAVSYQKFGDSYYYLKHQLIFGVIPGVAVFIILSFIDYKKWKSIAFPMLIFSIVLLVAVFLPGIGYELMGARRWIHIAGISFQPTEIVKLSFLLYLCTWLAHRGEKKVGDLSDGFMPFISVLGVIMFLIIAQPDVGTMSIIVLISLVVYFIAGAPIKHLSILGLGGIALFGLLIKIAPYRAARITAFLHPEFDPQGIGYHINQALLAIGTGGIFGKGFGNSIQKKLYLPEVVGDSIFAVIAEELGFIAVSLLVIVFVVLLYRGFQISRKSPDNFGKYLAAGITFWICAQAFVNIAAMLNLMPLTGLPLPLISYGSSSLLVTMAAIGILVNISKQTIEPQKSMVRGRQFR